LSGTELSGFGKEKGKDALRFWFQAACFGQQVKGNRIPIPEKRPKYRYVNVFSLDTGAAREYLISEIRVPGR